MRIGRQRRSPKSAAFRGLQPVLVGGVERPALAHWQSRGCRPRGSRPGPAPCSSSRRSSGRTDAAGQRLSSMPSAWISCLQSRITSSVSRMVKSERRPASSRMAGGGGAQELDADRVEGAEPGHALEPRRRPARRRAPSISRAALLVNVTERICEGKAKPRLRIWAMRVVSTRVLPVPAPASTSTGPSRLSTASACSGLRPERYCAAGHAAAREAWLAASARAAMPPPCPAACVCGRGAGSSVAEKTECRRQKCSYPGNVVIRGRKTSVRGLVRPSRACHW